MPEVFVKKHPEDPIDSSNTDTEQEDFEKDPVKTLLTWKAPSRPFRKKDRSYYTTIAIIVVLLVLILILAREFLLIGVIMALAFVAYVLGFVSPEEVEYKISTQGVTVGDHFYFWQYLESFFFTEKEGQKILNINTHLRFPGRLMFLLGSEDQEEVKRATAKYLPFHEIPPKNMLDSWAESLVKHFPLENPHK